MFTAALFTITKTLKQPEFHQVDKEDVLYTYIIYIYIRCFIYTYGMFYVYMMA